jgi:hypothetical protein
MLWIAGFAIGTATHLLELLRFGFLPYRFAPAPFNLFWTALVLIDPLVVLLLLTFRRAGLVLGAATMLADVAANSYTVYGLGHSELYGPLQMQTLFLGFVLGSFAFLGLNDNNSILRRPSAPLASAPRRGP